MQSVMIISMYEVGKLGRVGVSMNREKRNFHEISHHSTTLLFGITHLTLYLAGYRGVTDTLYVPNTFQCSAFSIISPQKKNPSIFYRSLTHKNIRMSIWLF